MRRLRVAPAQLARPAPPGGRWGREVPRHRRGGAGRPRSRAWSSARPPYPGALPDEVVDGRALPPPAAATTRSTRGPSLGTLLRHDRADVVVDVQNGVPYLSPLVTRTPVVNLVHHVHREQWPVVFGPRTARFGWWLESSARPARLPRHELRHGERLDPTRAGGARRRRRARHDHPQRHGCRRGRGRRALTRAPARRAGPPRPAEAGRDRARRGRRAPRPGAGAARRPRRVGLVGAAPARARRGPRASRTR